MQEEKASDLYLTVGVPPTLRIESYFKKEGSENLTADKVYEILNSVLTSRQRRDFDRTKEMNLSMDMGKWGRYRINVMRQRQIPALVIRRIQTKIPSFSELRLPKILESLAMEQRGLVLLSGMTGSGKSTSLAAMIDYRNTHSEGHIITIEDPIEYFHEHKKSVISQREVGIDTDSYAEALKNALRQRPDVILVGEIRDAEVMSQALTSAETGHLCLSTIHTSNAYQAIERIVNFFPEDMSHQIRLNLATNLKAIVSQRLIPSKDGGLVPIVEVLLNQGLIKELILKGEVSKMQDVMEQNNKHGMCTFDQSLLLLYGNDLITEETALKYSDKPSDLKIKLQKLEFERDEASGQESLKTIDTSLLSLGE